MSLTLHGIGTAVPAQRLSQREALAVAHRINADSADQARLMDRIYKKTTVLSRGSVLLENDVEARVGLERRCHFEEHRLRRRCHLR